MEFKSILLHQLHVDFIGFIPVALQQRHEHLSEVTTGLTTDIILKVVALLLFVVCLDVLQVSIISGADNLNEGIFIGA
jgi:hypothetical protein